MDRLFKYDSVDFNDSKDALVILDQTRLPSQEVFLTLSTPKEIFEAIYHLKVRGAPAIGIAAAFGLYVLILPLEGNMDSIEKEFFKIKDYLYSSRPTAVNLGFALDRMAECFIANRGEGVEALKSALFQEAETIKAEDVDMCERSSENGFSLLKPNVGILTHCNAGHLAVSRYGTALGPIHLAFQRGLAPRVFADETRPLMQGARLTAYELQAVGADVTLICDNMAAVVMQQGKIDIVMVGCDRIAINGDTANKIGTFALAILAKHFGIPFYILGPSSTIDRNSSDGRDILIEERPSYEVSDMYFKESIAPQGVKVYNPAFDITPAELITGGIITEKGIFKPPFDFRNK